MTDHYEIMGVEPGASKDEIRDAYRGRLEDLKVQAENGRSDKIRDEARAETRELNKAWQVLSDPYQRQRYDDSLATGEVADDEDVIDVEGEEASSNGAAPAAPARGLRRFLEPRTVADRGGRTREPRPRPERRPPEGVEGAEAAPLGRRLAAMGIDLVSVGAVVFGMQFAAAGLFADDDNRVSVGVAIGISAVTLVLILGYFVVPTARSAQTLGKRLVHIMVVDADTGDRPTWGAVFRRYSVPMVLLAVPLGQITALIALLFGFSWALLDTRVGLMDRMGRTRVVVARYQPPPASQ